MCSHWCTWRRAVGRAHMGAGWELLLEVLHIQTSMRVPSETFRYWNNFACPQTSKMASGQKYRYWTRFACPEDVQEGSLSDVQILNQFCMSRRCPRGVPVRRSDIEPVLHVQKTSKRCPYQTFKYWTSFARPRTSKRVPSETFRYWTSFAHPQTSKRVPSETFRY